MRDSLRVPALLITVIALWTTEAAAKRVQPGSTDLSLNTFFAHQSVSFDGRDIGSATQLQVAFGIGLFATSVFEVTGSFLASHSSVDPTGFSSSSSSAYGGQGGFRLNLPTATSAVPFVGAGVGVLTYGGDGQEDSKASLIFPRLDAGVRVFVGDSGSFNTTISYLHVRDSGGVEDVASNEFFFGLGVSLFVSGGATE